MSNGSNIYLGDGYLDGYHDTAATDGGTEPVGPLFSNGYSGDDTFYHSTEQQQQHLPPHPGSSDLIHLQPFFEGEQYDSSHQDAPNEGFDGTHFPDQEGLVVGAHELVPPPDNGGGGDGGYQQLDPYLPYDENEAFFQQLQLQQDTGQVNRPAQAFPVDNDQLVFPHEYDDDIFMGDAYFYDGDDGFLDNKDNGNSRANHFSRHDNKSNDGANANVNAGIDDIGEGSVLLPQVAAAVAATVVPTAMLMAQVAPAVEPAVIPNVAPTVPAIPAIEPIVVPDATPPQNPAAAAAVASPTVAAAGTVAVNGLNMKSVCHRCLERLSEMKKSGRKLCQIGASVLESNWKASGKACFGVCDEDEFCAEHGYPASVCAVSNKHEKHVVLEYHGSWIKVRLKRTFTQTSSSSSSSSSPGSEDSHVCSGSNSCCYGDYSEIGYSGPECKRPNIDSVYVQDISPIRCECAERLEKLMNTPWLQGNGLVLDRVRALLETAETSCKGFCVTPYCCSLHVCPGFVFQGESAIRCQGMPHSIWRNDDFWFYNGLWFKSESECMAAMRYGSTDCCGIGDGGTVCADVSVSGIVNEREGLLSAKKIGYDLKGSGTHTETNEISDSNSDEGDDDSDSIKSVVDIDNEDINSDRIGKSDESVKWSLLKNPNVVYGTLSSNSSNNSSSSSSRISMFIKRITKSSYYRKLLPYGGLVFSIIMTVCVVCLMSLIAVIGSFSGKAYYNHKFKPTMVPHSVVLCTSVSLSKYYYSSSFEDRCVDCEIKDYSLSCFGGWKDVPVSVEGLVWLFGADLWVSDLTLYAMDSTTKYNESHTLPMSFGNYSQSLGGGGNTYDDIKWIGFLVHRERGIT